MENRIKDCQLGLFANRMSAHAYKANQWRLIFAAFAYVLIDGIRRVALNNTALANAVPSTKPFSSRRTPLWRPHNPNSTDGNGEMRNASAAKPSACPKSTKTSHTRTRTRDPNDNQGLRHVLTSWLLAAGDLWPRRRCAFPPT